jgi:hypothetical protein
MKIMPKQAQKRCQALIPIGGGGVHMSLGMRKEQLTVNNGELQMKSEKGKGKNEERAKGEKNEE